MPNIALLRSQKQLQIWKEQIDAFLIEELRLTLHPQKSRVVPLSRGIDFVGFRSFPHYKLLRKGNIRNMTQKIKFYEKREIDFETIAESYQGW